MKIAVAITMVIAVSVFILMFVPNTFLGLQMRTDFDGDKFECGGDIIEVWTIADGTALRIRMSGRDYELKYFGSTLARDHYRSPAGEEADYDAELSLSGFRSGAGGTCY